MNDFVYGILAWIQSWVGSWGWSIVVFAILIRLVLTPLDFKSRVSMRKTQKLQPQLQALQKKYANDKEKLNAKTAELYKKEHINPLSSCLPLLLSWPVLIAVWGAMRMVANKELLIQLTQILNNEMPALEPWLWVKNLWMPDNLFSACLPDLNTLRVIPADQWQTWFSSLDQSNLPILIKDLGLTAASFDGNALQGTLQQILEAVQQNAAYVEAVAVRPGWTFNLLITQVSLINQYNGWLLLPILSAVSQFAMSKAMGTAQQQPAAQGSAAGSGKFMQYFFPLFSLVICLGYSAAFSLYWVFSGVASMAQTIIINKWLDNKEQAAKAVAGEGSVK
ncbi:YidC/Oxa1 family membrane protein insertase [Aristaeella hokkaidonensis]|uniref:YidC/Oxa1 family membrane protein insertase n=1 Tax=Aristaeella hokkaidonensis TaxID=3046382 RepID=A0AC61N516_9FIRM|nr:YidC/Oxa1 family membrane protein insertase [Aristaeella hokkaidonensis]QUC66766.1 YidC/Oxa1 family membrane protein insertase [Aristaeella hokkaidonensis]SNT94743.1 membrane protein insertase, YidC/Oxa1 family, C-terminal domain-containing protein [Aristaeella hokkaidonensis]